jgi:hypothetical protein
MLYKDGAFVLGFFLHSLELGASSAMCLNLLYISD